MTPILKSLSNIFQKDKDENGNGQITVAFSLPLLIVCAALLLCAIGWSFFIGLMVGRGQNPQSSLTVITGGILSGEEKPEENTSSIPEPEAREPLAAAETESPPSMPVRPASATPPVRPFSRPEGSGESAWPPPSSPVKKVEKPPKSKPLDKTVYDYSFQTAAFKNANEAESLKKKLSSAGLRCETRKAGKVYLVIVNMRGNGADIEKLNQKLASFRLGSPLQLARKEVGKKAGSNK